MKTSIYIVVLLIGTIGVMSNVAARSLCQSTETTIFSCAYKKKVASICASLTADKNLNYVQYRFGEKAAEISIPDINVFNRDLVNGYTTEGTHGGSETINFKNGEYTYQIVNIWDKGPNYTEVAIFKKETKISSFKCRATTDDRLLHSFIDENHLQHGPNLY